MNLIFHVDMDAFFAAIEQHDNPAFRGKPIAIGGSSSRSVVSTASYEARRFGVHSAMPAYQAKKLCPQLIFVPSRHQRYHEVSNRIMEILSHFTPHLCPLSIDEAFLDMSGTSLLFGTPLETAGKIKKAIFQDTGLTVSIGIAANAFLAKMASDRDKPDGCYEVKSGKELEFIDQYEPKELWGIGKKSAERIRSKGLYSNKQIRQYTEEHLQSIFGKGLGGYLFKVVRGKDPGLFFSEPQNRSISNEETFSDDLQNESLIKEKLLFLSQQVFFRLIAQKEKGFTAFLKIRYSNFETVSIQQTLQHPIQSSKEFYQIISQLFEKKWDKSEAIRLLGVGITKLIEEKKSHEMELFEPNHQAEEKVEKAVFHILQKGATIQRASLLTPKESSPPQKTRKF